MDNIESNSNSSEFTSTEINGNVVIGELHQREIDSKKEDDRFNQILEKNQDSIFILEIDPSDSNVFTNAENTFMYKAIQYAKDNGKPVEIMDDEDMRTDRYLIWSKVGTAIPIEDFDFMNSMFIIQKGLSNKLSTSELLQSINDSPYLDSERKKRYFEGFMNFSELVLRGDGKANLQKITALIVSFLRYDSVCRERYYQEKVSYIVNDNPRRKVLAIFGKSHTEGIVKTLEDPTYRTELPTSDDILEMIKEIRG